MTTLAADHAALLSAARRPSNYTASGVVGVMTSQVEDDSVSANALTLQPVHAEQFQTMANPAPTSNARVYLKPFGPDIWRFGPDPTSFRGTL
ncbi:MAG: hypothetical protein WCJ64_05390 [Rhodospirillaceae bacterium]